VTRWLTHESYGSPLAALSWVNRGGQNMSTFSNRFLRHADAAHDAAGY
jgi:hypothetical protein